MGSLLMGTFSSQLGDWQGDCREPGDWRKDSSEHLARLEAGAGSWLGRQEVHVAAWLWLRLGCDLESLREGLGQREQGGLCRLGRM